MASSTYLSLGNVALRGITMTGRFALLLAMANFLTPVEVGLYALMTAAVLWGVYLQGLEFYLFNLRELVAEEHAVWARRTRDSFVLYGLVFGGAVVIWFGLFSMGLLPWGVFGWFLAILALEHVAQELYRLLNVFGRPLAASLVLFARSGCWMYVVAVLLFVAPSARHFEVVLWGWTVGAGSGAVLALCFLRRLPWDGLPAIDWAWLRRGLAIALPLLAGSLAFRAIAVFDRWYLGYSHDGTALGVFGFYATIAGSLPVLAESGVGAVLYPKLMKAWQQGDQAGYRSYFRQLAISFATFLVVAVPLAAVTVVLVVDRLAQPAYSSELAVYGVLLASAAVAAAAAVPQYALWAKRRDRTIIGISVLGLATAVIVDLILVPTHGPIGAAYGQLAAMILMFTARVIALTRS